MNPRRVHELMRQRFPAYSVIQHEWINVADREGPMEGRIRDLLRANIGTGEVIVEVNRRVGGMLPIESAARYIGEHMGEGEIRIADREFTGFVVVLSNGVAAGWRTEGDGPVRASRGADRA